MKLEVAGVFSFKVHKENPGIIVIGEVYGPLSISKKNLVQESK
jgi:hypothetical protein